MEDLPRSLRDMISQKKGASSEIDYCNSKYDSDGKSNGDDYNLEMFDAPPKTKHSPFRLNSLEFAAELNLPPVSLSSNNSPNRGQDAAIEKVINFPKSARQWLANKAAEINTPVPEYLTNIPSQSDLAQKSDCDVIKEEEEYEDSNQGSHMMIAAVTKYPKVAKLSRSVTLENELCIYDQIDRNQGIDLLKEVEEHLNMPQEDDQTYFDFEFKADHSKKEDANQLSQIKPNSSHESNFESQNSSMMHRSNSKLSDKHISIPSFLIMTDATSVSKKIEQILSSKNYVEKQSSNQTDDVVAKIEVLIKRSLAVPVLKENTPEIGLIEIDPKEVHIPSPVPTPQLPVGTGNSRVDTAYSSLDLDERFANFSKRKAAATGSVQQINGTDSGKKTSRTSCITNLIALCNEKLKDIKKGKSKSPSPKPRSKERSTKVGSRTHLNTGKSSKTSINNTSREPVREGLKEKPSQSPRKMVIKTQTCFKVKRLSILQRNPLESETLEIPRGEVPTRELVCTEASKSPLPRLKTTVVGDFREYLKKKASSKRSIPLSSGLETPFNRSSVGRNSNQQSFSSTKVKLQAITQKYQSRGENSSVGSSVYGIETPSRKGPVSPSECRALSRDSLLPKRPEDGQSYSEDKKGQLMRYLLLRKPSTSNFVGEPQA